jgi:regulator of RNase E activity RraB
MPSPTEDEIQAAIAEHRARNVELRQVLIREGIELTEKRFFEVHFFADVQIDAALLAGELFQERFLVKLLSPFEEAGERRWTVEAIALVPPAEILGDQLTERLVRLAANCRAVYDGWGIQVLEQGDD